MMMVVAALKNPARSELRGGKSAWDVFQFPRTSNTSLRPATTAIDRFLDLSLFWITVVRKRFWEAIQAIRKLVEFRSPRQRIAFVPGMYLLFSQNAAERKRGGTELLEGAVLEIVTLTISQAYARFKCEAHTCNLRLLCSGWASSTVQCIVLDPPSIRVAHELVHLSVGNLGILRQIRDSDGAARFCRREQLGTTEIVRLITGDVVRCTFSRTWPLSLDVASSGRANA